MMSKSCELITLFYTLPVTLLNGLLKRWALSCHPEAYLGTSLASHSHEPVAALPRLSGEYKSASLGPWPW
jgi:hypothetical protein